MKYNDKTSICDTCYSTGWHTAPTKCTRQYTESCKCCGSRENGKLKQCKGTNILIDYSDCAKKFAPYYGTNTRIKVAFKDGNGKVYETKTGTVSKTNGWKPSFMLMLRSNSTGSSYLLTDNDDII